MDGRPDAEAQRDDAGRQDRKRATLERLRSPDEYVAIGAVAEDVLHPGSLPTIDLLVGDVTLPGLGRSKDERLGGGLASSGTYSKLLFSDF